MTKDEQQPVSGDSTTMGNVATRLDSKCQPCIPLRHCRESVNDTGGSRCPCELWILARNLAGIRNLPTCKDLGTGSRCPRGNASLRFSHRCRGKLFEDVGKLLSPACTAANGRHELVHGFPNLLI